MGRTAAAERKLTLPILSGAALVLGIAAVGYGFGIFDNFTTDASYPDPDGNVTKTFFNLTLPPWVEQAINTKATIVSVGGLALVVGGATGLLLTWPRNSSRNQTA